MSGDQNRNSDQNRNCDQTGTSFPTSMVTGLIDGTLTQQDHQRVSVHLESCADCRSLLEDLSVNREAALSTRFLPCPDDQWDERPRSWLSGAARSIGWFLLAASMVLLIAVLLWEPQWLEHSTVWVWLMRGAVVGLLAVLVSAAIDRWRVASSDVYRGVRK